MSNRVFHFQIHSKMIQVEGDGFWRLFRCEPPLSRPLFRIVRFHADVGRWEVEHLIFELMEWARELDITVNMILFRHDWIPWKWGTSQMLYL